MYTILIFFVVTMIVLFWITKDGGESISDKIKYGSALGILITMVFCILLMFISIFLPSNDLVHQYTIPLYSGFNDTRIEGNYYLLSGNVDEVDKVFYWYRDSDGGIRKYEAYMYNSKFYEEDRKDAELTVKEYGCKNENKWYFCFGGDKKYEFHIPVGSIYTGYNFK